MKAEKREGPREPEECDRVIKQLKKWAEANATVGVYIQTPVFNLTLLGKIEDAKTIAFFVFRSLDQKMSMGIAPFLYERHALVRDNGRTSVTLVKFGGKRREGSIAFTQADDSRELDAAFLAHPLVTKLVQ